MLLLATGCLLRHFWFSIDKSKREITQHLMSSDKSPGCLRLERQEAFSLVYFFVLSRKNHVVYDLGGEYCQRCDATTYKLLFFTQVFHIFFIPLLYKFTRLNDVFKTFHQIFSQNDRNSIVIFTFVAFLKMIRWFLFCCNFQRLCFTSCYFKLENPSKWFEISNNF